MSTPQFHIGIKNRVTADASNSALELHFLDAIEDKTAFDWYSMDVVTTSLVSQVMDQLNTFTPKKVLLKIDSWGGDADAGKGVYNVIKNYGCKVETDIVNKAASAATVIACAGSKIKMPATGMYVIHQASNSAQGTAKDLRAAADVADLYTDVYCDIYAQNNRKGKTKAEIMALIADGDYWMTGKQACEMGFVDECYNDESVTVTANIAAAKSQYKNGNIPPSLASITASIAATPAAEDPETNSILSKIDNVMKSFSEMVTAAVDKIKGVKVTAKVGDEMQVEISTAIAPILADLAAGMQTEVEAEMGRVTESVAALKEAYDTKMGALETANATMKTSLENITSDLTKIVGKQSPAMGVDTNATASGPTLAGAGKKASEIKQ